MRFVVCGSQTANRNTNFHVRHCTVDHLPNIINQKKKKNEDQTRRENVLKKTFSIWLDVDIKILNTRSKYNQNRPLLIKTNNQKIKEIYEKRKTIYKLAHHKILCDKLNKKEIVNKIIELYELQ